MIKLGIAPRLFDFKRNAQAAVDTWFNQVGVRFNMQEKNGAPTIAEVPENQWAFYKNTATSNVGLYVNDNGVLKSIASYINPLTITGGFALNLNVTANTNLTLPVSGTLGTLTGVETLTNKTLTSPVLTTPVINGTPTGTGVASTNTANTLVERDGSGNFSAGTITASLSGNATTATTAGAVTNAVTFNNAGTGGASGSTYNGAATLTVSYNTVGAPSTTGTGASGSWGISITGSSASTTGNAATATKLATARNINTVAFDGTADITVTAAAGTLTGTTLNSTVVTSSLTSVGTIGTGAWQGTVVAGQFGGTGVANTGKTITLGGNLTTSGAFATTFTMTNTTTVTFPVTGTLATLAGSETFTNKTITSPTITGGTHTGATSLTSSSGGATAAGAFTSSGSINTVTITDTGASGANILLAGNGGTNPNKYIRANTGNLSIVNSNYTTEIGVLSDSGNFTVTGYLKPGTAPLFYAYQGTGTISLPAAAWTKITMNGELYDTDNCYDPTVNFRFTPNIAGYYNLSAQFMLDLTGGAFSGVLAVAIYKNGSLSAVSYSNSSGTLSNYTPQVNTIRLMNGTTDYVEAYAYQSTGAARNIIGATGTETFFEGFLIRPT